MSYAYDNRRVEKGPNFQRMHEALMEGAMSELAMMMGYNPRPLQMGLAGFFNLLRLGLAEPDFLRLAYFYRDVATRLGAESLHIIYGRFKNEAYAKISGNRFPSTQAIIGLGFLGDGAPVHSVDVESKRLIMEKYDGEGIGRPYMEHIIRRQGAPVKVLDSPYAPKIDEPEDQSSNEFTQFTEQLAAAMSIEGERFIVVGGESLSPRQKELMEKYESWYYRAAISIPSRHWRTLNELRKKGKYATERNI